MCTLNPNVDANIAVPRIGRRLTVGQGSCVDSRHKEEYMGKAQMRELVSQLQHYLLQPLLVALASE